MGRWLTLALLLVASPGARAVEEIHLEEDIADLLAEPPAVEEETAKGRQWAVLPQVGFGPDTGAVGGLKFTHRNVAGLGLTVDVDGTYAFEQQQDFKLVVGTPHLLGDRLLTILRARYYKDPEQEFFGLGNNHVGPDPASTHLIEQYEGEFTVGWRPWRGLALNLTGGIRHVRIGKGDRFENPFRPFTLDAFPNLAGVQGGFVNPLGLSLVYTSRDEVLEPTRGWRVILKAVHTDRLLESDFQYTRLDADVGYLWSFWRARHVIGVRLNGGFIGGPDRDIPFWELERLGGDDTLRGFFPRRFLGPERVLLNLEYRFPIYAFDFFDFWHVRVGGAMFGSAGRVFGSAAELRDEFGLKPSQIDGLVSHLQYSYGGGFRIALSRALVARIDVGFSDEETGLVYLAFGQAF